MNPVRRNVEMESNQREPVESTMFAGKTRRALGAHLPRNDRTQVLQRHRSASAFRGTPRTVADAVSTCFVCRCGKATVFTWNATRTVSPSFSSVGRVDSGIAGVFSDETPHRHTPSELEQCISRTTLPQHVTRSVDVQHVIAGAHDSSDARHGPAIAGETTDSRSC